MIINIYVGIGQFLCQYFCRGQDGQLTEAALKEIPSILKKILYVSLSMYLFYRNNFIRNATASCEIW